MIRAFLYLLVVAALALAASWLADMPGGFELTVAGYRFETSLLVAFVLLLVVVGLVMILWQLIAWIFRSPAAVSGFFRSRRRDKGYRALSRGMVAAAAGDVRLAKHYSGEARRLVPREPLSLLLGAQAAQLGGDRAAARQTFEAMAERPDTEILGLRGLYVEASREGDHEAARHYAERAARAAPSLPWAGNALLDYQTREHDWDEALATVKRNADARLIDRKTAARQRAVLLTAKAQKIEDTDQDKALALAQEAHKLAPGLVPAAVIAGRLYAATGDPRQATKVVERAWKEQAHPDLAEVYGHARQGDSARDRLKRVRALADKRAHDPESGMAVAAAGIEAREWKVAREALQPLLRERPSRRACMLMAEIEEGETGDAGRVREWLSRALRAPRDPAWVADGYVSDEWQPVSPVTGELDAFEWRTPPELLAHDAEADAAATPAPALEAGVTTPGGTPKADPAAAAKPVAPAVLAAESAKSPPAPTTAEQASGRATAEAVPSAVQARPDTPVAEAKPAVAAAMAAAARAETPAAAGPAAKSASTSASTSASASATPPAATGESAPAAAPSDGATSSVASPATPAAGTPPKASAGTAPTGTASAGTSPTRTSPAGTSPAGTASTSTPSAGTASTVPPTGANAAASRDDLPRPPDDPGPDGVDDPDAPVRRTPVM